MKLNTFFLLIIRISRGQKVNLKDLHCSFDNKRYRLGNSREWGTPVPIPNTEVKPLFADDTHIYCRESRALPRQ